MLQIMHPGSHTFFDHTGDFAVDLSAPTLEGLYAQVAPAWIELLTDAPAAVTERDTREITV